MSESFLITETQLDFLEGARQFSSIFLRYSWWGPKIFSRFIGGLNFFFTFPENTQTGRVSVTKNICPFLRFNFEKYTNIRIHPLPAAEKREVRELEKCALKLAKSGCSLLFNGACLREI